MTELGKMATLLIYITCCQYIMTYKLNDKQYSLAAKKEASDRYDYFIKKVCNFEEIWSLRSDEGWVELSDSDGEICLPIWPHPDFAKEWATEDWQDCTPAVIKLDVWLERWTQGLENDNTLLVVFPVGEDEGLIQTPEELHNDLLSALN
ncbi:MAG: DUF2750 domain-containing protein [Sinobacterium sp.]|nr:DUF2750 domain-containing protein [Sinobacterium sp.]